MCFCVINYVWKYCALNWHHCTGTALSRTFKSAFKSLGRFSRHIMASYFSESNPKLLKLLKIRKFLLSQTITEPPLEEINFQGERLTK